MARLAAAALRSMRTSVHARRRDHGRGPSVVAAPPTADTRLRSRSTGGIERDLIHRRGSQRPTVSGPTRQGHLRTHATQQASHRNSAAPMQVTALHGPALTEFSAGMPMSAAGATAADLGCLRSAARVEYF